MSAHMMHMRNHENKPTVLVDMDGTWFQWGKRFNEILLRLDPSFPVIEDDHRRHFDHLGGPGYDQTTLQRAFDHPDLYDRLEPIPGATEAILAMDDAGFDVFICSTPTWTNPGCVAGKLADVDALLGSGWTRKLILTHDKTVVSGDVLIDDKPTITGAHTPSWRHLMFDQAYNQYIPEVPRLHAWAQWEASLYPLLGLVRL